LKDIKKGEIMAQVIFTIENGKLQRIINAIKYFYPVPRAMDESGEAGEPLYSDAQWVKEVIRKWIIGQVKTYENLKAKEAVSVNEDNTLLT
jgi:hypothetical protein